MYYSIAYLEVNVKLLKRKILSQTVFDSQLIANEQIMHRTNRMACVLYANWNDSFGSSHSSVRRHPFRTAMRRRPMIAANGVVN